MNGGFIRAQWLGGYTILPSRSKDFQHSAPELMWRMPKAAESEHKVQAELHLCARKGPFKVRNEEPWQNCVGNPARHLPSGFPSPICANIWLFQDCYIHSLKKKKMQRKYLQEFFPAIFIPAPLSFGSARPNSSPTPRKAHLSSPQAYISPSVISLHPMLCKVCFDY